MSNYYWFKRKTYGWGWTPASWQGWLTIIIYLTLTILVVLSREEAISGNPDSGSNFLVFGVPFIVLTLLFIFVAHKKGEKPKWQWGSEEKKDYIMKLFNIILILIIACVIFLYTPRKSVNNIVTDYKNGTYTIEGKEITLKDGYSEIEIVPQSTSKLITRYFGNDLVTDVNGDSIPDTVFLVTQNNGGSGTFYYVVSAINTKKWICWI